MPVPGSEPVTGKSLDWMPETFETFCFQMIDFGTKKIVCLSNLIQIESNFQIQIEVIERCHKHAKVTFFFGMKSIFAFEIFLI
jgi:hypothetical protein